MTDVVAGPIFTECQRWRERRTRYRPTGELFDPRRAEVQPIDEKSAKAFVSTHHYSGTYPAARYRVGIFLKDRFTRERLAGVVVFSVPMNQASIPKYFSDLEPNAGVELGRLVLLDELAANAESWFLARAFRFLRQGLPDVRGVLSYSDPVARYNESGELFKRGHAGVIYQAMNGCYRGRSSKRTLILGRDGRVLSERSLSKLRNGERGEEYAYRDLLALGAPERRLLEGAKEYVARALRDGPFRRIKHPGNHCYTWRLGVKVAPNLSPPALPYPRG
jgi:hypothetical protein